MMASRSLAETPARASRETTAATTRHRPGKQPEKENTMKTATAKKYYALSWNPDNAYQYSDDAIRDIGCQIAEIVTFDSKAERDEYVDGEAYTEAISAKRAYRINPTLDPSFRRHHPNW